jgi:hypothetical protein
MPDAATNREPAVWSARCAVDSDTKRPESCDRSTALEKAVRSKIEMKALSMLRARPSAEFYSVVKQFGRHACAPELRGRSQTSQPATDHDHDPRRDTHGNTCCTHV